MARYIAKLWQHTALTSFPSPSMPPDSTACGAFEARETLSLPCLVLAARSNKSRTNIIRYVARLKQLRRQQQCVPCHCLSLLCTWHSNELISTVHTEYYYLGEGTSRHSRSASRIALGCQEANSYAFLTFSTSTVAFKCVSVNDNGCSLPMLTLCDGTLARYDTLGSLC